MNAKLAVLRQCTDRVEAETIRIRLAADEIQSLITGSDSGTALSMGGASTSRLVRVEVKQSDFQRADALLKADRQRAQEAGSWNCQRCHEYNESAFDVCWSCNKIRGGSEHAQPVKHESLQPSNTHETLDSGKNSNPQTAFGADHSAVNHLVEVRNESVARCARAAVVGLLVLPPLFSCYSIYLLLRLDPSVYRVAETRSRVWAIWGTNVLVLALGSAFWLML